MCMWLGTARHGMTDLELLDIALDVLNVFVSAASIQDNIHVFSCHL